MTHRTAVSANASKFIGDPEDIYNNARRVPLSEAISSDLDETRLSAGEAADPSKCPITGIHCELRPSCDGEECLLFGLASES